MNKISGRVPADRGTYWGKDNYLHRFFIDQDPIMDKSISKFDNSTEKKLLQEIKQIRDKEDAALKGFLRAFGYDDSDPEEGLILLRTLRTNTNKITQDVYSKIDKYFTIEATYGKMMSSGDEKGKKAVKEILIEESIAFIDNNFKVSSKNKQYENTIKDNLKDMIQKLIDGTIKGTGVSVSYQNTTIGNYYEYLYAMALRIAYLEALDAKKESLKDFIEDQAVIGSIPVSNVGKRYLSDEIGGKDKLDKRIKDKQSAIDVEFYGDLDNPLPMQMKVANSQKEESPVSYKTPLDLLMQDVTAETSKFIKFAIIHQHAFSDSTYRSMVEQVADKKGMVFPSGFESSDPSAIESLKPRNTMDRFKGTTDILEMALAVKTIGGLLEGHRSLFYVIDNTQNAEHGGVMRTSKMLEHIINNSAKTLTTKVTTPMGDFLSTAISSFSVEGTGDEDKIGIPLYEKTWYNATKGAIDSAYSKIAVTTVFNYGKMKEEDK